jgi:CDP-diacylglycerol--serine O-phosphatidyltransferase
MKKGPKAKRRANKKGIYILPSLLTSASLFGGFFAIIASIQARYESAAVAIFVSAVFDALDGKIARFTGSTSRFGTEYDSLADLVAFGIAPAVLVFQWRLAGYGRLGWLACFTYVICGALRLARFNVQKDTLEANYFKGLPIPAAATFIASLLLFSINLGSLFQLSRTFTLVLLYGLSFLMVSTIDYLSFKEFELRKQKPFSVLVGIILTCLVIVYKPRIMLFAIMAVYILSGPVVTFYRSRRKRSRSAAPGGKAIPLRKEEKAVETHEDHGRA